MKAFAHLRRHGAIKGWQSKPLYSLAIMLMFWAVFDGIVTYVTPIAIIEAGYSKTQMGLIIGASSIVGALFDFLLCRFVRKPHFRRYFMGMFALCLVYPLILGNAHSLWVFLLAMTVWGIYFDLQNFGKYDFVGRATAHKDHAASFGVLEAFTSTGYIFAPVLAGLAVGSYLGWSAFILAWFALLGALIAYAVFLLHLRAEDERHADPAPESCSRSTMVELKLWSKISRRILPVLILSIFLDFLTSLFYTIGPLLAESFTSFEAVSGLFVAAYDFPILLVGWLVGWLTIRYGQKRTALVATLLGSLFLVGIGFMSHPLGLIGLAFVASSFFSLASPALSGTYADYISEAPGIATEFEAIQDFSSNIGYFAGPILTGMLADVFGNSMTFTIIGVVGILLVLVLFPLTPRSISVRSLQGK